MPQFTQQLQMYGCLMLLACTHPGSHGTTRLRCYPSSPSASAHASSIMPGLSFASSSSCPTFTVCHINTLIPGSAHPHALSHIMAFGISQRRLMPYCHDHPGGDAHLGGDDFDAAVVDWLRQRYLAPNVSSSGLDLNDPRLGANLKALAEAAKMQLTDADQVTLRSVTLRRPGHSYVGSVCAHGLRCYAVLFGALMDCEAFVC